MGSSDGIGNKGKLKIFHNARLAEPNKDLITYPSRDTVSRSTVGPSTSIPTAHISTSVLMSRVETREVRVRVTCTPSAGDTPRSSATIGVRVYFFTFHNVHRIVFPCSFSERFSKYPKAITLVCAMVVVFVLTTRCRSRLTFYTVRVTLSLGSPTTAKLCHSDNFTISATPKLLSVLKISLVHMPMFYAFCFRELC